MVHVGSTYQGIYEMQGCEALPDANTIMTVTSVHHAPFFNSRVFLRATFVSEIATKYGTDSPVTAPFFAYGYYSFATRQMVLLPSQVDYRLVQHPYKVICTFHFGDNDHADCTVNEIGSSHECGRFRLVKV